VEPFQADKISSALFAASESLGEPDAFLARELTQGVLFFLDQENLGDVAEVAQIAELAAKVVRELGQPRLAQAFADKNARRVDPVEPDAKVERGIDVHFSTLTPPQNVLRSCMSEYSLAAIFGRDLAAAHRDGLLTFCGLEHPLRLLGRVCEFGEKANRIAGVEGLVDYLWHVVSRASGEAGSMLVLDGLEHILARLQLEPAAIAQVLAQLREASSMMDVNLTLHFNCAEPPAWAGDSNRGPLFTPQPFPSSPGGEGQEMRGASGSEVNVQHILQGLLSILGETASDALAIDWHLQQADFDGPCSDRLPALLDHALANPRFALVFDRPRRGISLGHGMDRTHPAVLLAVGLNLPQVLRQRLANRDPASFLDKLGTLVQMAVSAALQKRRYLREHHAALGREFLLDRARLVAAPLGVAEVAEQIMGEHPGRNSHALDFTRQIMATLAAQFHREGAAANLDCALDASLFAAARPTEVALGRADVDLKTQLRVNSVALGSNGSAVLLLNSTTAANAQTVRHAWQRTDIARVQFVQLQG